MRKGITLPDGSKLKIPSPNLFDAVVVSLDSDSTITQVEKVDINFQSLF